MSLCDYWLDVKTKLNKGIRAPTPVPNNDPPHPHSPPMTLFATPPPPPDAFVSVAQNQADFGDASAVSQWAPFVLGLCPGPSITETAK